MAERPSDDWFRSAGWAEHAGCWSKDYYDLTFISVKHRLSMFFVGRTHLPEWSHQAYLANDPVALHNAWIEEEKRRATPLDPDGWTHLKNVGEHTSGYHYVRQTAGNDCFNVFEPDGMFFAGKSPLDEVIAACNEHARENGVKSC